MAPTPFSCRAPHQRSLPLTACRLLVCCRCVGVKKIDGVQQIKTTEGEEDIEAGATSLTSLLPRFRQAMHPEPPYVIESRARELILGWHKEVRHASLALARGHHVTIRAALVFTTAIGWAGSTCSHDAHISGVPHLAKLAATLLPAMPRS